MSGKLHRLKCILNSLRYNLTHFFVLLSVCRNIIQTEGRPRRRRSAVTPVNYTDKDSDVDMEDEEKGGAGGIVVSDADDESEGYVGSEGGGEEDD